MDGRVTRASLELVGFCLATTLKQMRICMSRLCSRLFTFPQIEIKAIVTARGHTIYLKLGCGNHVAGSVYRTQSI
jgi:hypothetical protein